ncbi:hypothetical protein SSA02_08080 [Swaminathania salitolerans]|uniref:Uncharacterized protein n=1 Tax=Swaminathania salitolerans TaxID=182838 RepID=A0A511BN07_9PROT|nr:hypothetical protein SSA02_08080 [Swaminathania salitolerans]
MIDQIAELDDETLRGDGMFERGQIAVNVAHHTQATTGTQPGEIWKGHGRERNRDDLSGASSNESPTMSQIPGKRQ